MATLSAAAEWMSRYLGLDGAPGRAAMFVRGALAAAAFAAVAMAAERLLGVSPVWAWLLAAVIGTVAVRVVAVVQARRH
ncbi:MAG: hypothetical protein S0880_12295 [Actinomycetota bacterium]|nr:hypothetical protein [Actinomycetota bacterium]